MTYQKNSKVGEVVTTTHDLPSIVLHPHHTRTSLCGPPPKTLIQRKVPIRALHMDSRKKLLAVGRRREEEGGGRKREEEGGGRRREEGEGGGRRREEGEGRRRREEGGGGRRREKGGSGPGNEATVRRTTVFHSPDL